MSDRSQQDAEDTGIGCLLIGGIVIVSIAIGNIYDAAHGWLVLGISMLSLGIYCIVRQR